MESEIVPYGEKFAVVIEKALLEQSHIKPGSRVNLSTHGESIVITAKDRELGPEDIEAPLDGINARYGQALKRLAE